VKVPVNPTRAIPFVPPVAVIELKPVNVASLTNDPLVRMRRPPPPALLIATWRTLTVPATAPEIAYDPLVCPTVKPASVFPDARLIVGATAMALVSVTLSMLFTV